MGKRKKKRQRGGAEEGPPAPARAPRHIHRPFAEALRGVRPAVPAPAKPSSAARPAASVRREPKAEAPVPDLDGTYEDRVARNQAYAGVAPLRRGRAERARPSAEGPASMSRPTAGSADRDAAAREYLSSLAAGGIRFDVREDEDGGLEALRVGAHPQNLRVLRRNDAVPEEVLDLHGTRAGAVGARVGSFVRERHRRGDRVLLIIHGRGRHSQGGQGVLRDHVVEALTRGGAAPVVLAFATAPRRLGGAGALLVQLGGTPR